MQLTQFKFEDMVTLNGNQVMTDSLKVSDYFGKRHSDILRAIKKLGCSSDFAERNFAFCQEINILQNNKPRPFYKMTKDGFVFLVMGFTGESAALIKENYINAFNWMAEKLYKMQHGFMQQQNSAWLEYTKEKDKASEAGKGLSCWRHNIKPKLTKRLEQIQKESQINLNLN